MLETGVPLTMSRLCVLDGDMPAGDDTSARIPGASGEEPPACACVLEMISGDDIGEVCTEAYCGDAVCVAVAVVLGGGGARGMARARSISLVCSRIFSVSRCVATCSGSRVVSSCWCAHVRLSDGVRVHHIY
jgi:hypothetical protein